MQNPNFILSLEEMDAGILADRLSRALADVAIGVVEHNKKGKVVLTLDLDRIGESSQVNVSHKLNYIKPTLRGKATEELTTTTPMYVNREGYLSVAPDMQVDIFKTKSEENA